MAEAAVRERVCLVPECCSLATVGDYCEVHTRYRKASGHEHCLACARALRAGEWCRFFDNGLKHLHDCLS